MPFQEYDFLESSFSNIIERVLFVSVKLISGKDVEALHLPGRDLQWIVTGQTIGAEQLSIAIMTVPPRSVVRPMHAHKDIEEVIYILEGQGEAWVDGEKAVFRKGDAVLFPKNSKHQVRNISNEVMMTVSIFAGVTSPDSYINYEDEDAFAK